MVARESKGKERICKPADAEAISMAKYVRGETPRNGAVGPKCAQGLCKRRLHAGELTNAAFVQTHLSWRQFSRYQCSTVPFTVAMRLARSSFTNEGGIEFMRLLRRERGRRRLAMAYSISCSKRTFSWRSYAPDRNFEIFTMCRGWQETVTPASHLRMVDQ